MFLLVKLAHADNFALNVDVSPLSDDVPKSAAPNMLASALGTVLGDNPACTVLNCYECDPTDGNKCTRCSLGYTLSTRSTACVHPKMLLQSQYPCMWEFYLC
ncbi:unnamed protein product [Phytomonas sp. Hart1]|nr:unnamed protein product [Phytomonas sp. Hart1]|eukprot:CCW71426.1 unnamed protein product [Phytomonas sp. isolate Hart1]